MSPGNYTSEIRFDRQGEGDRIFFEGTEYALLESDRHRATLDGEGCKSRGYSLYIANQMLLFSISGGYSSNEITAYIPGDWTDDFVKLHHLLKEHANQQKAELGR